jgi:hypothetical protein
MRLDEAVEVPVAVDEERAEETAEEQDLGDQEQPDAEASGVELRVR